VMPRELVLQAIEQSASREPVVRAMALLQGARVLAVVDKEAARRAFAEGVTTAENLPLNSHDLELVLNEAVRLGATADAARAIELFRRLPVHELRPWQNSTGTMLLQSLAKSGEMEAAVALLEDMS